LAITRRATTRVSSWPRPRVAPGPHLTPRAHHRTQARLWDDYMLRQPRGCMTGAHQAADPAASLCNHLAQHSGGPRRRCRASPRRRRAYPAGDQYASIRGSVECTSACAPSSVFAKQEDGTRGPTRCLLSLASPHILPRAVPPDAGRRLTALRR
jgi:hypothetical protein